MSKNRPVRKIDASVVRPMEIVFVQLKIGTQYLRLTLPEVEKLRGELNKIKKIAGE